MKKNQGKVIKTILQVKIVLVTLIVRAKGRSNEGLKDMVEMKGKTRIDVENKSLMKYKEVIEDNNSKIHLLSIKGEE